MATSDSSKPSLLGCAILQRLAREPRSGYELKRVFTTPIGYGWRAYDTQIYRELKALEQQGLVQGQIEPGRGGPQRRVYEPTLRGLQALRDWFESPLDETAQKSELTMRVWSIDMFPPGALEPLISTQRQQMKKQLEHMAGRREELRKEYGPPEVAADPAAVGRLLVLEHDMEMTQLKLRWLERVEAVMAIRSMLEDSPAVATTRRRRPRT